MARIHIHIRLGRCGGPAARGIHVKGQQRSKGNGRAYFPGRTFGRARVAGLAAVWLTLLAGCADLSPAQPVVPQPVPQAWQQDQVQTIGQDAYLLQWQDYFTDPALVGLIQAALAHNRDLRLAVLRVAEARASYGIQRADQFPSIGMDAQGSRARMPDDLSPSGTAAVGSEYRAQIGMTSWELDLWGRVRNLSTAALQEYLASDANQQAVRIALIAEVAQAYVGLRALDARVAVASQTIDSRTDTVRIFRRRLEVGAASALALTQAETLLHQAQNLGVQLAQARDAQRHALQLLAGTAIELPSEHAASQGLDSFAFAPLASGLPSDLLVHRPDIMAAEHRLRAANASIGAARAAFFPRIALTAGAGSASADLNGLFASGSRAWSFVPVISLPIFDGGRRHANLELAEVRQDIAVATYEKTIQVAFREVADLLSAQQWLARQVDILRQAQVVQVERTRLAQLRYDNGAAAYLEVLDAQRELLDTQQQQIQAHANLLASQVALYAALGGGAQ